MFTDLDYNSDVQLSNAFLYSKKKNTNLAPFPRSLPTKNLHIKY
jgi:hypothetical protein